MSYHPRTSGREIALKYLYMHDVLAGQDVMPFENFIMIQLQEHPPESSSFARDLVESVIKHKGELDADISAVAANWDISRMAAVDRNILRLSITELSICPDTSHKVIINEAVELAKRYSSEEAGAFVNGLLDRVRLKLRPDTKSSTENEEQH
jgi:N utilization substance protein B